MILCWCFETNVFVIMFNSLSRCLTLSFLINNLSKGIEIDILFNHKKRKKLKVVNFKKIVLQCILAGMYFQFLLTFFSTFPP
jgi:hypothetical protein